MPIDVTGKVVIITGGAGAIGSAIARRLVGDGAKVVVADIQDASALQSELRAIGEGVVQPAHPGVAQGPDVSAHPPAYQGAYPAMCIKADVSSPEDALRVASETEAAYGRIDVLINNAGLYTGKPFEEITLDDWRERMRVNLEGPFLCIKAVLPAMKRQHKGKIINIGSDTVWMGTPGLAHYVTSKGGLLGLTRALATELGPLGVTTVYVTPTLLDTPGTRAAFPQGHFDFVQGHTPIGRLETPDDITGLIMFLCSDDAAFVNGAAFNIGGGISMH